MQRTACRSPPAQTTAGRGVAPPGPPRVVGRHERPRGRCSHFSVPDTSLPPGVMVNTHADAAGAKFVDGGRGGVQWLVPKPRPERAHLLTHHERSAPMPQQPEPAQKSKSWKKWAALAAAVVLLVIVGLGVLHF